MTTALALLHVWAGSCALALSFLLWRAGRSPGFRFRMGREDRHRRVNFHLVAYFMFAVAVEFAIVSLGVDDWAHFTSAIFTCLTGTTAATIMAVRAATWKA